MRAKRMRMKRARLEKRDKKGSRTRRAGRGGGGERVGEEMVVVMGGSLNAGG